MSIENFQRQHNYFKYSDLEQFIRMDPIPKRCAAFIGNVPCEYYTVPRLITDKKPAGYTAYTANTIYDVNCINELVRISVRVPKYKGSDGKIYTERFFMMPGEYTHEAMNKLHSDFCDPGYSFESLCKNYPLGKNASQKAYELLLPWAKYNHVFPGYPIEYSFLQFTDIPYKDSTLTFCLVCTADEEPSLFDILVDDNFDSLADFYSYRRKRVEPLYICLGSNTKLYQALHKIFPNATYIFDPFSLIITLEQCATETPDDKQLFRSKRSIILDALKKLYINHYPAEKIALVCESVIKFLLNYPSTKTDILNTFRNNMQMIIQQQPGFMTQYYERYEFHSLLLFQLKSAIQDFLKSRGYGANRLAYMLLASIKALPYVDPYVLYDIDPPLLTDEEFEGIEQIASNTLISSIVEQLKWMSDGPFIY